MAGIGPVSETPAPLNLFVGSIDPRLALTSAVPVQNAANLYAFQVTRPVTVTTATVTVGVANGNVDLGIYSGPAGGTGTWLGSTGSTAVVGSNAKQTISLTAPVTLVPGVRYWAALAADGATVQFYGFTSSAAVDGTLLSIVRGASFPLPTTSISLAAAATGRFHSITFG
jgi:hypothetical protein